MAITAAGNLNSLRIGGNPFAQAPMAFQPLNLSPVPQDTASIGSTPARGSRRPSSNPTSATSAKSDATPMQQAQAIVAQAHAVINQIGNSTKPIGESQAGELVSIVDSTSAQLQALSQQAGTSDPSLTQYIQGTLSDLASAKAQYSAMVSDIGKDDQQDQTVWQQADQSVEQDLQAEGQSEDAADPSILGATIGSDEGDPSGGSDS